MSAYSKFCDYIRDTLFNGSMKGGYVSFVIDDTYINDACKAIGVSKTTLFNEVRRFMLYSPHYTLSSHPFYSAGIIVIELYTAFTRGLKDSGYRSALGDLLGLEVEEIESWMRDNQDAVWEYLYKWCHKNDFKIVRTPKTVGPWRYVRYIINYSQMTLNQNDLKYFGYDFYIHGLSPDEEMSEREFWKSLGGKMEIVSNSYCHTQRSTDILLRNYNDDSVFTQIYTYFCYRWDGSYIDLMNPKKKLRITYDKYRLYLSQDMACLEVRDENFDKVFTLELTAKKGKRKGLLGELSHYYQQKRNGIIVFKPNDLYEGYWEETRYIDNADHGIALIEKEKIYRYGFRKKQIQDFGKWILVSFEKGVTNKDFFSAEKRPFKFDGGLSLGLHRYMVGGEPTLWVEGNTRFWLDGEPYESEEDSVFNLTLPKGKHVIKFKGYNPIKIFMLNPRSELPAWKSEYFKWEVSSKDSYIKPVREASEGRFQFVGLDFSEMNGSDLQSEVVHRSTVQRWILAHRGIGDHKERNYIIRQLKEIHNNEKFYK